MIDRSKLRSQQHRQSRTSELRAPSRTLPKPLTDQNLSLIHPGPVPVAPSAHSHKVKSKNTWPKDANRLSGQLRRLMPSLREAGIVVTFGRTGKRRSGHLQVATFSEVASKKSIRRRGDGGGSNSPSRVFPTLKVCNQHLKEAGSIWCNTLINSYLKSFNQLVLVVPHALPAFLTGCTGFRF